jgi:hypothetical protein
VVKSKISFQSEESILCRHVRSREWIEYKALITIKDSGRQPVSIDLEFQGIQLLGCEMPVHKMIRSENLSSAFLKLMRFLKNHGIEMK